MAQGYHKTTVIGNLGGDPEFKQVSGKDLATFSVAVTKKFNDKEFVTWYEVEAWEGRTKACQYLKKGKQVHVEGTVKTQAWIDKTTGEARAKLVLNALEITLLGSKNDNAGDDYSQEEAFPAHAPAAPKANGTNGKQQPDDEIVFF